MTTLRFDSKKVRQAETTHRSKKADSSIPPGPAGSGTTFRALTSQDGYRRRAPKPANSTEAHDANN
jgi:hypothetical protein